MYLTSHKSVLYSQLEKFPWKSPPPILVGKTFSLYVLWACVCLCMLVSVCLPFCLSASSFSLSTYILERIEQVKTEIFQLVLVMDFLQNKWFLIHNKVNIQVWYHIFLHFDLKRNKLAKKPKYKGFRKLNSSSNPYGLNVFDFWIQSPALVAPVCILISLLWYHLVFLLT